MGLHLLTIDEAGTTESQSCATSLWYSDTELREGPHQGDSLSRTVHGLLYTLCYSCAVSGK